MKNGLRFLIMPLSDNNNRMGDIWRKWLLNMPKYVDFELFLLI